MQMVMTSDETQIQIFANWPMSRAIRKLRTDTSCPAGKTWPNHVKNEQHIGSENIMVQRTTNENAACLSTGSVKDIWSAKNRKTSINNDARLILRRKLNGSTTCTIASKLLGTDNARGQISEHIFAPNGDYCLYVFAPNGDYYLFSEKLHVKYSPIFKPTRFAKNIWRIISTIVSIWGENMLGYLSLDIICFSKLTVCCSHSRNSPGFFAPNQPNGGYCLYKQSADKWQLPWWSRERSRVKQVTQYF